MVEGGPQSIDRGINPEGTVITAQSLYDDNHSPQAEQEREDFEEKSKKRQLIAVIGCSDARTWTAGEISLRNIAGAIVPTGDLVNYPEVEVWNSDSHFDSDTLAKGVMPIGCGGLAAKDGLGDQKIEVPGVLRYASEKIEHPDPIVQAIITAENIAPLNGGKPVIATTQDHLTGRVYPIAFFQYSDGEEVSISAIPRRYRNPKNYDPAVIYANGTIPTINESHLPQAVQALLERNKLATRELLAQYPNLRHKHKVHRPELVLWTTDRRFARKKFPATLTPGSTFKIHSLRTKDGTGIGMDAREIEIGLDQLSYPIEHAVKNHGNPDLPFSNTSTVAIETGDMQLSRRLARRAMRRDWMRQWLGLGDRRIVILQTNDGIVNDRDEFQRAA